MKNKFIYLDHAATSWPKPREVQEAVRRCMEESGGNPGRGSHRLASRAAEEIYGCRETAAAFFDTDPERVVCTSGATMGVNLAITGLLRKGDHVLIDSMAHNAVYRPVYHLARLGVISFTIFDVGESEEDCIRSVAALRKSNTILRWRSRWWRHPQSACRCWQSCSYPLCKRYLPRRCRCS